MRRIFTERFFRLSAHDQVAVVEAVLQDIEKNYGRYITTDDEKRANEEIQQLTDIEIKRIEELFKAKEKEILTV